VTNRWSVHGEWTSREDRRAVTAEAAAARRIVAGVLRAWRMDDLVADTQLVVSELVGNAFQHAPGPDTVELELVLHDDAVHVHVNDGSALRPMVRAARHDEATGRGLRIVEALSERWGVADHEGGKQVRAEIRRPDGPGAVEY
jgi:anti-sigma regulatory factor (Ser/Thr protein kinase)